MFDFPSATKLDSKLLSQYVQMAKKDHTAYYISLVNGNWLAFEYLDESRDSAAYYYITAFGSVTFGPDAREQASG